MISFGILSNIVCKDPREKKTIDLLKENMQAILTERLRVYGEDAELSSIYYVGPFSIAAHSQVHVTMN